MVKRLNIKFKIDNVETLHATSEKYEMNSEISHYVRNDRRCHSDPDLCRDDEGATACPDACREGISNNQLTD